MFYLIHCYTIVLLMYYLITVGTEYSIEAWTKSVCSVHCLLLVVMCDWHVRPEK